MVDVIISVHPTEVNVKVRVGVDSTHLTDSQLGLFTHSTVVLLVGHGLGLTQTITYHLNCVNQTSQLGVLHKEETGIEHTLLGHQSIQMMIVVQNELRVRVFVEVRLLNAINNSLLEVLHLLHLFF